MTIERHLGEKYKGKDPEFPIRESKRLCLSPTAAVSKVDVLVENRWVESFLRNLVRESVEGAFQRLIDDSNPRPLMDQFQASQVTKLQLHFEGTLRGTHFKGSTIQSQAKAPIQIVISKGSSKEVITSGPLSSKNIEILLLNGEFGKYEEEDWTEKEFDNSVIRARENKMPLLTGNLRIKLQNGVGQLNNNIVITDNSSWVKNRKFRLGARVVGSSVTEERVREARSEAFFVKDARESNRKRYPPFLGDEIYRLENIAKGGAFQSKLTADNQEIKTVQEFLRHLVTDPEGLRKKLGSRMTQKSWEATVRHAMTCELDSNQYKHNGVVDERLVGLLFNCIYEVLGAAFDGHTYQSLDNLTASEKILVEKLKIQAYANTKDIVQFDGNTLEAASIPGSSRDLNTQFCFPTQDEPALNYCDVDPLKELMSWQEIQEPLSWQNALPQDLSQIQLQIFSPMNNFDTTSVPSKAIVKWFKLRVKLRAAVKWSAMWKNVRATRMNNEFAEKLLP
ncbi:calmodulin-binding protein 60 B-like isoform X3 [Tasmannia lanceolata]|uniref:calmodulin-binding protein 60 B-like isoform X2 n=1 Tax=Tasmannia lanceolata TaxID=3420 RepID=UPI0040649A4C